MAALTFRERVLQLLQDDRVQFAAWKDEPPKTVELSRQDQLEEVLQVVLETIAEVEELDDGPPVQDESALAHNELDQHDVPRTSTNPDGSPAENPTTLPLWFRVRRLAERDGKPSPGGLVQSLTDLGRVADQEPPHIHVPTRKDRPFPTQLVAGMLDSIFNNDQGPIANYAAKLMSNSKACETCDHFYDASLDECPNPKCPAEYVTDELEPLE